VYWPSILAVPRLDYMEVVETNRPRSYFHHIPLGPVGFRINILRSATGRAYLAFCGEAEHEAVLARLRASQQAGNAPARRAAWVACMLNETRRQGYAVREPDFGGHYDKPRSAWDDGRNSIALPIAVGGAIVGCVNLTWIAKVAPVQEIVRTHLASLREATEEISHRMHEA
jgi:IclR family transcriptional regulator, mhp operon transcriptional activator